MIDCPVCASKLKISRLHCGGCQMSLEGQFALPRLMRLPREQQRLAEAFLLSGGNLKDLAARLGVSYPTLRKRVDEMVATLDQLQRDDEAEIHAILDRIESGEMTAEQGTRLIREVNGEL